jgi:hypothetical protein
MEKSIKERIIEKGIISKKDWDKASPTHKEFAKWLLAASENEKFLSGEHDADLNEFAVNSQHLNDLCELDEIDKVESDKKFESDGVEIGIPVSLIPFLNDVIYPLVFEDFKNEN